MNRKSPGWGQICTAPAKINLSLRITGKRADGYHELESRMLKLELADRLFFAQRPGGVVLRCPDSELPLDEGNLVYRAAKAFLSAIDADNGLEILLEKRVPIAAGLGGGSSDAAATLRGLNRLYDLPLSQEALFELARPLGADVPFFVADCTLAWATGIGDLIEAEEARDLGWIVLVNPGFAVSTPWVYENFTLTSRGNPYILPRDFAPADTVIVAPGPVPLYNDLESVTIGRYPELAQIKDGLLAAGAYGALMSGSGPTVFGLFAEQEKARVGFAVFAERYGAGVFLTRPLTQASA